MKRNTAKTLIAMGLTGALVLGAGASALADEAGAASDSTASAAAVAVPAASETLSQAISSPLCEAALSAGKGVDADEYLPTLGNDVEWTSCGASTYGIGDGLMGSGCSDGSVVTETSMGVAHKTLPLGTQIQISYNGRVVNATVCDRGPFVAGRDIDLQPAPAVELGFDGVGTLQYRILA